jgi:hypothetical protein
MCVSAHCWVTTVSGSIYEIEPGRVRRLPASGEEHVLRRDGKWLVLRQPVEPRVGLPMVFWLDPLGEGSGTTRTTTPVVAVEWADDSDSGEVAS